MDDDWKFYTMVAAVVGSVTWLMIAAISHDNEQWAIFAKENNCKVVSHHEGEMVTTFGVTANGQSAVGFGSTSAQEGWLCDDGITYYRTAR